MIFHLLTAVLFLLQVLEVINISWWLVLAPSLVYIAFSMLIVVFAVIIAWRANQ